MAREGCGPITVTDHSLWVAAAPFLILRERANQVVQLSCSCRQKTNRGGQLMLPTVVHAVGPSRERCRPGSRAETALE